MSDTKPKLSTKQQLFKDEVISGRNIFLSGKAGTGKTFIVKDVISELIRLKKKVVAIAPTGVAANNLGGQTIHSMFSINPFGVASFDTVNFLRQEKQRMLDEVDVIFVDEISMLSPDVLDAINWTLLKNGCKGIHTKQLVFIGDLKQLEPPVDDNTRSILFRTYDGIEFFNAKCYDKLHVNYIELDEVLRQSDIEFITALNAIRDGGKHPYFKQFVSDTPRGVVLAPHNTTVEKYNKIGFDSLKGEVFTFTAKIEGNLKADDFNLQTVINVKQGAKIMYLANSKENNLVNGTLGIFVSHNNCHYIRVGNVDYNLQPMEFTKKEYVLNEAQDELELREIGKIEQYPIKLAYALSIHKSQGLTFSELTVDLSRPCFAKGQMYVALSRVTSPDGLTIITGGIK